MTDVVSINMPRALWDIVLEVLEIGISDDNDGCDYAIRDESNERDRMIVRLIGDLRQQIEAKVKS